MSKWWLENDGYGIVGWSFWCSKCNKATRFSGYPYTEMSCEHCGADIFFTEEEVKEIENSY